VRGPIEYLPVQFHHTVLVWQDAVPIVGDGDDCSRADTADDNLDVRVFVAVFTGIFEQFVDTLELGDDDVR